MPAWGLKTSGSASTGDWFLDQLAVARATLTDAGFDTIIGTDFANGVDVDVEFTDVVGVASAATSDIASGGIVTVTAGNDDTNDNSGRLALKGAGSHVKDISLSPWFLAGLVKITQPLDETGVAGTRADAVNVWADVNNWVAIGMFGNASGGSPTRWVGSVDKDAGITTTFGPPLDGVESPVWHLFYAWLDPDGDLHFAIDGQEFDDTIAAANVPALPGVLSAKVQRSDTGDVAIANYDKIALFVKSPTVGDP